MILRIVLEFYPEEQLFLPGIIMDTAPGVFRENKSLAIDSSALLMGLLQDSHG